MAERNLSHQFVSATLWNTLLFPARLGVGLLASIIFYRRLSLDQVGILFLLQSLATTVGLYADLGIERTLPRFLPEVERAAGRAGVQGLMTRVIRVKLIVLLLLVAGLAPFTKPAARALLERERREIAALETQVAASGGTEATKIERTLAAKKAVVDEVQSRDGLFLGAVGVLLLLGALFDVYMQFLTAYLKQRAWNLITLASTLLQPLLVTAFVLAGWGIGGVLLGLVLAPFFSSLLAAWQVALASRDLAPAASSRAEPPNLAARFTRFAGVNYLMQVTTWIYDVQFVVFLSAVSLSLTDVALLGFAYKFTKDLLSYVWTPLNGVITPVLSRVHVRGENRALQEAQAALTRIIWLILVPAGVGLLILAPRILQSLYPKYVGTLSLVAIFVLFTFGESLLSVPQNVLMVVERYTPVVVARLVAFLTIPLLWLLLPRYGVLGVALAAGAARLLSRMVTMVWGSRELGLTFPIGFAARVVAASAAMALFVLGATRIADPLLLGVLKEAARAITSRWAPLWAAPLAGVVDAAIWSLAGALVFVLALRLLGGLHEEDRRRIAGLGRPWAAALARAL
jgi:O-antigen/teichoic acid export membrane protein